MPDSTLELYDSRGRQEGQNRLPLGKVRCLVASFLLPQEHHAQSFCSCGYNDRSTTDRRQIVLAQRSILPYAARVGIHSAGWREGKGGRGVTGWEEGKGEGRSGLRVGVEMVEEA